ncbi:MAG TPA: 2-phospho-L-lactate guanylyltransferase [Chloroflexota bacterium]|nr:2-phospho-L-lactate guanylyltransferase [Chloroflexota bacterium]
MKTVALVPAKVLAGAKSRLIEVVDEVERGTVVLDMLSAVLEQLREVRSINAYAVVTSDERAAATARQLGAVVVAESSEGLNLALDTGRAWAIERGAEGLLVVLSDLPLVLAGDLDAVVRAAGKASVTIAPSKDGGTNALLLRPVDAIPFRFGRDSARYHRFEAMKLGLELAIVERDSLAFDVDTPQDLAVYRAARQRALARL